MSQSSISQGVFKKMKNAQIETKSPIDNNSDRLNENDDISFYKPSRYLKMPRKFLLNSLRLQLNCSIKRKKEQRFTLSRLELFDKQFCLHQIHHLYQKYLDFGLQYQIWPRILCHTLPKAFDDIPIEKYQNLFGNEANKIMLELKRRRLNDQLKKYELKLQHYENLYQTEINIFESKLIQISLNHQDTQTDMLMILLKCYLSHYTNRLIRQIRYKEACVHVKLVRKHHRHLLSKQQIVDVYPQIIVDVPKISLNRIQLDYLSKS
ncbi:unnamed protein product, partial [Rotaria socialis]